MPARALFGEKTGGALPPGSNPEPVRRLPAPCRGLFGKPSGFADEEALSWSALPPLSGAC
jgi:hypothetical protein